MTNNPFATTDWETSSLGGGILAPGDHVVTIDSVDGTETSSGGHPQIVVKAHNDQGSVTDWIVVIDSALWRAAALFAACGLEKPIDTQVTAEGTGYRLADDYLSQCVDKKVGVIVRSEPDFKDPTKNRSAVKGWVKEHELSDTGGFMAESLAAGGPAKDDIPF